MLDQKTLDHLWDFDNPELSEQRFREAMADEKYDADERAELATQLGRAIGLQARFEEADALLDAIDSEDEPTIGIRIILERLQEWMGCTGRYTQIPERKATARDFYRRQI
ncbi:MAG: hypothetical protein K0R37_2361, partial [Arthrobacter sp.]|nr:hypothetical protein [Arthrobacter sp.]